MRVGYSMIFEVDSKHSTGNLPKVTLQAFANGAAFNERLSVKAGTIAFSKVTSKAETAATDIENRVTEALLKVFEQIRVDGYRVTPTQRKALRHLDRSLRKRVDQADASVAAT